MIQLLLVSKNTDFVSSIPEDLDTVKLYRANSGNEALTMVSEKAINLVITDESLEDMTGLEFAKKLVSINPMVNCAAVSSLSPEDFHEASEGLGLMTPLPVQPEWNGIEKLLLQVNKILSITGNNNNN